MRFFPLFLLLLALATSPVLAQQTTRRPAANGYHHTRNVKAKARSGAYARYDRTGRRNEDDLKLAPGLRLNMPSPPTTDYMGRPLKKKPAKAVSGATSLSADKPAPAAPVRSTSQAKSTLKRR